MKRFVCLTLVVMLSVVLSACASATTQTGNKMINPGDKIGDFLITTGKEGDVTYTWELGCTEQGKDNYSCQANAGTKINISVGIYDDTFSGKLEDVWAGHTYELNIENRPVNLQAFGTIDINHPKVGKMRHWNVVVLTDKPGEITLHDSGVVHSEPFESTMTYTFTAP